MKDIDRKEPPDVSGGYSPNDDGCVPPFPIPIDYPPNPFGPVPEPVPGFGDPVPVVPA